MTSWYNVASVAEFKPNTWRLVDIEDFAVMVFNIAGKYHAIQDICTHDGGTLSDGDLEGCEIICPRHGARFDVRTGEVTAPPAYEDIQTFPVRVENGMVQVGN